ncbi:flagellin [Oceanisphaera pacifica]|uniref:Flagellin n=1 Tax=Oceanisphaera pacifica TaxID=2818389 RepID=A0ABS3NJI1_9GAMM|nr:flagellin [Oceanisphaera pacifica]MBO1520737.1 flagellin [Oceanisphaera pacifica]
MAITVNTNVTAMGAQRNLNASSNHLATSMERLSTGSRINSAKDDAAGLQISNRLNSQARGLGVAMKNAQDGNSIIQTAEGALNETTELLQRMRDLAAQGANDTNSADDRVAIQEEMAELIKEIDNIADTTKFGGQKLLNGEYAEGKTLQIGADEGETLTINIKNASAGTDGLDLKSTLSTVITPGTIATASDVTAGAPAVGTTAAVPAIALGDTIGAGEHADYASAITTLDGAIKTIDGERAKMGATQNRLESTINNLANTRENVSAGMSRIKDVDFAQETVNLTKQQILQQAGTSILAQAKQIPQAALSLLG